MKQSEVFLYTLHDPPADAEVPSHKLLAQAGFVHKLAAGVYSYAPALWRVLKKISNIVREEMDAQGAQEVMLPILQPREIWDSSGRWDTYVNHRILFHFRDRKNSEVCLGPTHEEAVTTLTKAFVSSYRQLPLNLYQIQTKFRDEIRPRFGLMRGREFIMKDAYSFDADEASMNKSYDKMSLAYSNTFRRCGLKFSIVEADAGAIGGSGSQEFVVQARTGEDVFIICDAAGYAANQERAVSEIPPYSGKGEALQKIEKVKTPATTTIDQLTKIFPDCNRDRFLKAVTYKAVFRDREEFVLALIRGDREVNEVKLQNCVDSIAILLASDQEISERLGLEAGYIGPVNLKSELRIIADNSVQEMVNFVSGANEADHHYRNVNLGRDFPAPEFRDICLAVGGDRCLLTSFQGKELSATERVLIETRGIEVGHIFKLGKKYSATMEATFTNLNGKQENFWMGCYGIGVSRIAAAAIEQGHDEKGMIWPIPIAPWVIHLLCVNTKEAEQVKVAEQLYQELVQEKFDVLYDDRPVSPGVKFNDADLIGIPLRITVGRHAKDGLVELVERKNLADVKKVKVKEVVAALRQY